MGGKWSEKKKKKDPQFASPCTCCQRSGWRPQYGQSPAPTQGYTCTASCTHTSSCHSCWAFPLDAFQSNFFVRKAWERSEAKDWANTLELGADVAHLLVHSLFFFFTRPTWHEEIWWRRTKKEKCKKCKRKRKNENEMKIMNGKEDWTYSFWCRWWRCSTPSKWWPLFKKCWRECRKWKKKEKIEIKQNQF